MFAQRILAVQRRQKICRYHPRALMDQLIKGMLAVGAGLTPHYHAGIVIHLLAVAIHSLAVTLHVQLLQIGREAVQILVVRQHGIGSCAEEVTIPDAEQSHQHRNVFIKRSGAEMFVHRLRPA